MDELIDSILLKSRNYFKTLQREIYLSVLESFTDLTIAGGKVRMSDDNIEKINSIKPNVEIAGALKRIQNHSVDSIEKILELTAKELEKYNQTGAVFKEEVKEEILDHAKKKRKGIAYFR